jgi:hypothetical protein
MHTTKDTSCFMHWHDLRKEKQALPPGLLTSKVWVAHAGLGRGPRLVVQELQDLADVGLAGEGGPRLQLLERVDTFMQAHSAFYAQLPPEPGGLLLLEPAPLRRAAGRGHAEAASSTVACHARLGEGNVWSCRGKAPGQRLPTNAGFDSCISSTARVATCVATKQDAT